MDYAFAPGPEMVNLRTVLSRRPNTTLIDQPGVTTVAEFLQYLKNNNNHADDLIIGSHGTDEGQLLIALDQAQTVGLHPGDVPQTIFETLQTNHTIVIPATVKGPDTSVRLFGCLIGSLTCRPFLTLLKQRFGSPKNVSAPQYVHTTYSPDGGVSFFEYMKNDFKVFDRDGFKTRAALITAYKTPPQHYLIDGHPVPDANWEAWIPGAAQVESLLRPAKENQLPVHIPVTVSPAAGGFATLTDRTGNWVATQEQYAENGIPMSGSIPPGHADFMAFVEKALGKDPGFGPLSAANPYPVYERYFAHTLHEFVQAWNWSATERAGGKFDFLGTRFRYDVFVPVTASSTSSDLIYNYYPATGSANINFTEWDPRLFGVV